MHKLINSLSNEIIISLVCVMALMLLGTSVLLVRSATAFSEVANESQLKSANIPTVLVTPVKYSAAQYQEIIKLASFATPVVVGVKDEKIVVAAPLMLDEKIWRQAVSDILSLDKKLHTVSLCGSSTSACSQGMALVAEIEGHQQVASILN